jgi:hypothetical protein
VKYTKMPATFLFMNFPCRPVTFVDNLGRFI